jgi:hypothetical protein
MNKNNEDSLAYLILKALINSPIETEAEREAVHAIYGPDMLINVNRDRNQLLVTTNGGKLYTVTVEKA